MPTNSQTGSWRAPGPGEPPAANAESPSEPGTVQRGGWLGRAVACWWVAVLSVAVPGSITAQEPVSDLPVDPLALPRPELRALRIDAPIELDGALTEEAWARADATDPHWIQIGPDAGFPGDQATIVRVLYDDDALYFGADLYDPDPEAAIAAGLDPDYDTASSDLLGVALDTFHDRANGFVFAVNPAGAVFDAQTFNDQRDVSRAWEGIVEVETRLYDDRWTVEMRIPLSTLRYDPSPGEQVWGLNFSRRVRRRNEDTYWAALPRQFRVYKFSLAGTLTGLEGLGGGRNLWLKPAALVNTRITSSTYSTRMLHAPSQPDSSATTAKIESLVRSGR